MVALQVPPDYLHTSSGQAGKLYEHVCLRGALVEKAAGAMLSAIAGGWGWCRFLAEDFKLAYRIHLGPSPGTWVHL